MEKVSIQSSCEDLISNAPIPAEHFDIVSKTMQEVHRRTQMNVEKGFGPFYAMVTDQNNKFIAGCSNTVVMSSCSLNHAEVNTIRAAQEKLNTYDLSSYDLNMYISAEPCIMCVGAIMWSGIKNVYYSVKSEDVELITGFDEGYKPSWHEEFSKLGINVCGNIESKMGKKVLHNYMTQGHTVYKPKRGA